MRMRDRSAILLIILAVVLFAINWPLNNYISDPETWHSRKEKNKRTGQLKSWRPPKNEGANFFGSLFQGGGGTPAILAMFGGQRYLIANIMWSYSDILFHQSADNPKKLYDMARALEAVVTLNPSFVEAWSTYGWHLAWNLNADATMKDKIRALGYLKDGEKVYLRAIDANPEKPRPYFDLAWLYLTRTGEYDKAWYYLNYMTVNFQPLKPGEKHKWYDPLDADRKWDPKIIGNRLAYVYKKLGIVTREWKYIDKAMDMYQQCIDIDSSDKVAKTNLDNLRKHYHDAAWLKSERDKEETIRHNFEMTPLDQLLKDMTPMEAWTDTEHKSNVNVPR